MSRKERVVAAIKLAIAAGAQSRRGLAERLLAGVLLAVAVAGAVLIPRLLVGSSPQHELGVGAPSVTGPPVVLAPGLHAQKSQPQTAAGPQSHATRVGFIPSASTSQPTAQGRPATRPASPQPPVTQSPPPVTQSPPPPAQPQSDDSQSQPTIHALTPAPLVGGVTTCNGTYRGTGKDVVVPSGATCVLTRGTAITHDLRVSPGGRLIDPAVTVGHDLVAHSPAGISIDGGSVGHDLRIEGLSGSAGVLVRIYNTTVGHDLVVAGNANAVALAGNSVGHNLRVDRATPSHPAAPKPPAPPHPHPAPKPKPPKPSTPQKEPNLPEPPKSQLEPPKPHPDHPRPQHTPPPTPVPEPEQHGHGNGHKS